MRFIFDLAQHDSMKAFLRTAPAAGAERRRARFARATYDSYTTASAPA